MQVSLNPQTALLTKKSHRPERYQVVGFVVSLVIAQLGLWVPESYAQGPQQPTQPSEPVDIQANEQEFVGDQILAKGNVRVTYKESIVLAPQATLFRDSSGTAQKAIFTGHPRLIQGLNKIDADTLIFEIANQRVVADGNAYSEVISNEAPAGDGKDGKKSQAPAKSGADNEQPPTQPPGKALLSVHSQKPPQPKGRSRLFPRLRKRSSLIPTTRNLSKIPANSRQWGTYT